jgi:hypothetical protein
MTVLPSIEKLSRHAHPFARPHHGTLDNRIDVEGSGNFGQAFFRVLELHYGRPGNNPQRVDLGQVRDQLVGHSVGEVFLAGIAREVIERKHGNGTYSDRRFVA